MAVCPCFKTFRKLVALLDVVIGSLGIALVSYLLYTNYARQRNYENGTEQLPLLASELQDELDILRREFKVNAIMYIFPSVITLFLGVLLFVASHNGKVAWSRAALGLNFILIIGTGAIVSMLFGLGVYWKILVPVALPNILQLILILVVFDLYRSAIKSQDSDSSKM